MKLDGIHHVTCITGDAPQNVEFYADTLGLRIVKKTVNQDDPTVYHLFYADEHGRPAPTSPSSSTRMRRGAGPATGWCTASSSASSPRSRSTSGSARRRHAANGSLLFDDPEGLALELIVDDSGDEPLVARHPEIPAELALRGFAGVRAYASTPQASAPFLGSLGFDQGWSSRGDTRGGFYVYDEPPAEPPQGGPAPCTTSPGPRRTEEHASWVKRVTEAGGRPTPVIDRFYFRSIYFREPSGVLFEIATLGPGFPIDEAESHSARGCPAAAFEPMRDELEPRLTPLPNPRELV